MINKRNNFRNNSLFTRNEFKSLSGYYEIPIVKKQKIDISNLKFITYADTKHNDTKNKECGVVFFVDDWRFYNIFDYPEKTFKKLSQYPVLCTPEYSLYGDLKIWRQIEHVAKNSWVGAWRQSKGLNVIPSVNWGLAQSFDFCFDGVEKGSIVAIGMIGCKSNKSSFIRGYNEMLKQIDPETILCYGTPFKEMKGNIIQIDYWHKRKGGK